MSLERVKQEFEKHTGEPVEVEDISGTWYAFGSELATLRLFRKYAPALNINQGWSENLGTFYFSLQRKYS